MHNLALLLLVAAILACADPAHAQMPPPSPCPDVYSYDKDPATGDWIGLISLLTPARYSEVRLEVTLSSSVPVAQDEVGDLVIRGGQKGAMDATRQVLAGRRHVLQYHVIFPKGKPVPALMRFSVNGRAICDTPAPANSRSEITLNSFLSTGVNTAQSMGQDFQAVDGPPPPPPPPPSRPTTETDLEALIESIFSSSTRPPPPPPTQRPNPRPTRPTTTVGFGVEPEEEFEVDLGACGNPTPLPNTLVVNGSPAVRGQWPWQTALFKNKDSRDGPGITFQCGGSLITRRHIITAAHCVVEKKGNRQKVIATNSLVIYLGKHNLKSWTEKGLQTLEPERITVHPGFNENLMNDLSVILLNSVVELTVYVKPICLWSGSPDLTPLVDKVGMVAGWGFDETNRISDILRTAPMPVVSQETCIRSNVFYLKYTSNTTLCAGYNNGTSVCNGDSGGGLMFHLENNHQGQQSWFLRGVVSVSMLDSGMATCSIYNYVVFTDVAQYLPWIHEQLRYRPS